MGKEDKLRDKYGSETGFKVPDGYFMELNRRILDNLPAYPVESQKVKLSRWDRLKPYVYLAAMFAGIWLMMHLFHNLAGNSTFNLENPPEEFVQLIESNNIDDFELQDNSEPEFILEEEVLGNYDNIEDFEKDFGYTLKPEYAV